MDTTSPLVQLGQQLHDFLVTTCTPPPGSTTGIAFLPVGVGVSSDSFYIDGVVNPALVQSWLSVVADPIVQVVDQAVTTQVFHATLLMQLVASAAQALTDPDTPQAQFLGLLKNQASGARMPASDVVDAAPLDWYDVGNVPNWPTWTSSVTGSPQQDGVTEGGGEQPGPTPSTSPIWRWRELTQPMIDPVVVRGDNLPPPDPRVVVSATQVADSRLVLRSNRFDVATARTPVSEALNVSVAAPMIPAERVAVVDHRALLIDPNWLQEQGGRVGGGTPVAADALQLSLSYQLVQLSRTAWWSDSLIGYVGWCLPGERSGSVLPGSLPSDTVIGLPIALIITDNVRISGSWSDTDRQAAAAATNLGPWALQSAQIDTSGVMAIPGMPVVAMLYQQLPDLPPTDDPALPPLAPAPAPAEPSESTGTDSFNSNPPEEPS